MTPAAEFGRPLRQVLVLWGKPSEPTVICVMIPLGRYGVGAAEVWLGLGAGKKVIMVGCGEREEEDVAGGCE